MALVFEKAHHVQWTVSGGGSGILPLYPGFCSKIPQNKQAFQGESEAETPAPLINYAQVG